MNIIKNTFRILAVAAALAFCLPARAQTPAFLSFLQNYGGLLLPYSAAATSTNYSTSYSANYTGTNGLFWIKSTIQTNSTTYPPTSGLTPVWAQGVPFSDVDLWANRDGTAPLAAFNISAVNQAVAGGAATNIIKVTLTTINRTAGSMNYFGPIYNNSGQNVLNFTVTNTAAATNSLGQDIINLSTNLPASFMQGALAIQMQLNIGPIGTNGGTAFWTNVTGPYNALVTNTVSGWMIQSAGISGFKPDAGN